MAARLPLRALGVASAATLVTLTTALSVVVTSVPASADNHYPYRDSSCPKEAPYRVSANTCSSDPNYKPPAQTAAKGDTSNITTTGTFRGETARQLADNTTTAYFGGKSPTLFLASAEKYPDAIAATPLVKQKDSALFLYGPGNGVGQQQLQRMGTRHVIILGGEAAVDKFAEGDIKSSDPSITTERIAGVDRYDTAARISQRAFASGSGTTYIASGQNFPDALSAGAAGAARNVPVLLSDPKVLPNFTLTELRRLQTQKVVLIGGTVAVSDDVFRKLQAEGFSVSRVSGTDRYLTAVEVAKQLHDRPTRGIITDGNSFQAALVASAPAAKAGAALLLKTPTCTPAAVQQYANGAGYTEVNAAAILPNSAEVTGIRHGC